MLAVAVTRFLFFEKNLDYTILSLVEFYARMGFIFCE